MDTPKSHVYTYQMKFEKREMSIGKIKTEFQRGLLGILKRITWLT